MSGSADEYDLTSVLPYNYTSVNYLPSAVENSQLNYDSSSFYVNLGSTTNLAGTIHPGGLNGAVYETGSSDPIFETVGTPATSVYDPSISNIFLGRESPDAVLGINSANIKGGSNRVLDVGTPAQLVTQYAAIAFYKKNTKPLASRP